MAFELLEGVTPFGEIGGGMQKSGAEIPFINAQVSDALKFTIFKMLSKDTWDRPTASTLVEWANNPSAIQIDYSLLNPEEPKQESAPQVQPQPTPITNTTNETIQTEGRATQRFGSVEQKENTSTIISYSAHTKDNTFVIEKEGKKDKSKNKTIIFTILGVVTFVILLICVIPYKSESEKNLEMDLQYIQEGKFYAKASIKGESLYQNEQFTLQIERYGSSNIYYEIIGADYVGEEDVVQVCEVFTTADYVSQYSPNFSDISILNYIPANSNAVTVNFYIDICDEKIKLNTFTFFVEQMTISNDLYSALIGKHALSLQWLSKTGSINIEKKNGIFYGKGEIISGGDYLYIDGTFEIIDPLTIYFTGEIREKVSFLNGGNECYRKGKYLFKSYYGRKYWRMQKKENCEGNNVVDYIDIYF